MKNLYLSILLVISVISLSFQGIQQSKSQKKGQTIAKSDVSFLKNYHGKYPYELKLLSHAKLKPRIIKLIGVSRYKYLLSIFEVETPIKIENGLFYSWAMKAHSGGDPSAMIMVDITKNILYLAIREGSKVTVYSEPGGTIPDRIKEYKKELGPRLED